MNKDSFVKNNLLPRMIQLTNERESPLVLFNETKYLLCSPNVIQEAFVKKHKIFTDQIHPFRETFDFLFSTGSVALKAAKKSEKNKQSREISENALDSLHSWMIDYQQQFMNQLAEKNSNRDFHIYYDLSLLFLNFALKFLFNFNDNEIAKDFLNSVFDFQLNAANKKQINAVDTNQLKNQEEDIIKKRFHAVETIFKSMNIEDVKPAAAKALAKTVLNAYIGTANTTFWLLYLLNQNPSWKRKMLEEVEGKSLDDRQTYNDLPITEAVINETIRLYPTACMLLREAQEDSTIAETLIKKGTTLGLCIYSLHRDPKFWTDPNEFQPERFIKINNKHPDFFLPFGVGPRKCVGQDFTYYLLKNFIINFLTSFQVDFNNEEFDIIPQVALQAYPEPSVKLGKNNEGF